jgi:hypothetical protein
VSEQAGQGPENVPEYTFTVSVAGTPDPVEQVLTCGEIAAELRRLADDLERNGGGAYPPDFSGEWHTVHPRRRAVHRYLPGPRGGLAGPYRGSPRGCLPPLADRAVDIMRYTVKPEGDSPFELSAADAVAAMASATERLGHERYSIQKADATPAPLFGQLTADGRVQL